EKSDFIIDYLAEDGSVIGTETKKGISYSGEMRASLVAAHRTVIYPLQRKGLAKAFVRARVLRNGKTILTKDSPHVTFITQSPPETLWLDYSSGGPPLSINAHISFDNP